MKRFVTGPNLAGLVGVGFIVIGVLGFVPGVVDQYGGLSIDRVGVTNVVPVNRADDWLHIGLGVAMVYAGVAVTLVAPRQPAAAS
jgi:hypothetical protein